jgi:glycosyltransferase involved in cell wall biosynthesis
MTLPISVVMISLNEAHNMPDVLANLKGWAEKVFLVDSYSDDDTVEIALANGVHVVQRTFRDFGDQWNYAVSQLPIETPWTMKLDPDERLTDALKSSIAEAISGNEADGFSFDRRLWFMGEPMPVRQEILRIWRTGTCRFSDAIVNERPRVSGTTRKIMGEMEHHDSPNLHHWFEKQNRYMTAEAMTQHQGLNMAAKPSLVGSSIERRMWLKKHFSWFPGRYALLFLYHALWLGAWRAGRVGWIWSRLRTEVYRSLEFKAWEMKKTGRAYQLIPTGHGAPHPGAVQAEDQ